MDGQYFTSENQTSNKDIDEMKNAQTTNKLQLRKNHLNNILIQKAINQDNEIENQKFQDLQNDPYMKQHEEIKYLMFENFLPFSFILSQRIIIHIYLWN